MSNVVKSRAVVDDRVPQQRGAAEEIDLEKMPVIKKQIFSYVKNPYADETLVLPDKQGYLDELNRLKVEIAQARAELRIIRRETDEAAEEENNRPQETPDKGADAQAEAEQILNGAKVEAADIIEQAEQEAGWLKTESQNQGYLEGFEKGFAQAADEFKAKNAPKIKQLEDLLEKLSNYQEEMIARNETDLLDVAITVAEKIVGHEISADPRAVVALLYQTLDNNRREENLRITVSPDLLPIEAKVGAEIKKLITDVAPNAMIYVEKDLGAEACYVETDKGITDLSVKTQLKNAKRLLEEN